MASSAAAAVWGLVLCRIVPAAFYLVDQDLGAVESMTHAWSRSARSWPALMALHVVMLMLTQPLSLVSLVAQFQPSVLGIAPTAAMGLPWLSMLFGMAASAFYYVAMASAYDQIEGRGAYARVD